MPDPLSLAAAQALIRKLARPTSCEEIPLHMAAGRVAAKTVRAPVPVPAFCRSTMDGYAIRSRDIRKASPANPVRLRVTDVIPAGRIDLPSLHGGEAIRVMTGAALPGGADQVVPFELCREEPSAVQITNPGVRWGHIRRRGSDLKLGSTLLHPGELLVAEQLPNLAECGLQSLPVHLPPRVAVLCTGSELQPPGSIMVPGRIVGGNRYLLGALIRQEGGIDIDLGLARDDVAEISSKMQAAPAADMVITTGGMGPGDYDLLPEVYSRLGISIHYDSLDVRPGRSTMMGSKNGCLYFALPGPPPAVRLLFHELVRPAILALRGIKRPQPSPCAAILAEPVDVTRSGMLNLKGAVYRLRHDQITVRPARKHEPFNAILLIAKNRRSLRPGERVTIHPLSLP